MPDQADPSPAPLPALLDRALLLDLETTLDGAIREIGAVRGGQAFHRAGTFNLERALADLSAFAGDAAFVIGHNLLGHDLPTLRARAPALALLARPIIDTLYLSPLAFPENPYHRLVKNYKLVRASLSDPVADCRLAAAVLAEQVAEFSRRGALGEADLLGVYQFCFRGALALDDNPTGGDGIAEVLRLVSPSLPNVAAVRDTLLARWQSRACANTAPGLILAHIKAPLLRPVLAYAAAWLQVAGGSSVLPPWVRHRFPATVTLLKALRDVPCGDPACTWCQETHDPVRQLRAWFDFAAFRPEPPAPSGVSLQQVIVADGIAERSLLALLPTGGGKSLCFQLPALVRYLRRGTLTVVISPLQALMKDQVDNLVRKAGTLAAAAIHGLLTPPERGDVIERVRLGDVAILYISPEQLRNESVAGVLASREIGCWVFDEAHCLSKWGHDFRPDYLYAGRFIRTLAERQRTAVPPVACFTATAKLDVTAEILAWFQDELDLTLTLFEGGVERENLAFEVQVVNTREKPSRIHQLLCDHLGAPTPEQDDTAAPRATDAGTAVVYAASRRHTEELALDLEREGWAVAAFHAGLDPTVKKQVQEAFLTGELQVICATNAFGMGVDKDNVRLVIHADIPGSLENYIQEAGRAGRDRAPAHCVLLYDPQDIEKQFSLEAHSELSKRDIEEIWRGLYRAKRDKNGVVVVTSGELLRDEDLRLGFDTEARDADTRVRIAVAWLERAGLVRRDENRTRVFQGRPKVADLDAAERLIAPLGLSAAQRARWLAIMSVILNADPDAGIGADELAQLPAFARPEGAPPAWDRGDTPAQRVLRTLHDMAGAGLLHQGPQLTAFIRYKVRDHSVLILERVARLERAMLAALKEEAPDAACGEWLPLSLRRLNQHLLDTGFKDSSPDTLRLLLKGLTLDGRGLAGNRGSLDLRQSDREHYRLKLHRDWQTLTNTAERRRDVAGSVLATLLAKAPPDSPATKDLLVAFGTDELTAGLQNDLLLAGGVRDPLAAVDRGLLFLHEHGAIVLHGGFAVFRSAMTVQLLPEAHRKRYTKAQHQPLEQHYGERVFQIHVMDEYARRGAEKIRQALALVAGYFSLSKEAFVLRWFPDRAEMLTRATTADAFRRIVDALGCASQTEIVAAPEDGNRLVLAGPGAGKTRVIVHRCAYLLRVLRVPAQRLLVLCFNRGAALDIRRRLIDLVGEDGRHVTVQTYHGFALRLTGRSLAARLTATGPPPADATANAFERIIPEAVDLLEGRIALPGLEPDALRERLLAGFRHILVDEYQDIDADQYQLVSAIAGRTQEDAALTLLAVGDDDQNIYAFRGASVEYIQRFQTDYHADLHYLVENYRSTGHIIAAANALIGHNRARMKGEQPIRIDRRRANQPPGGDWTSRDAFTKGRVLLLRVADPGRQAAALVDRLRALRALGAGAWSAFAVLARSHEVLAPLRACCAAADIPVSIPGNLPALHRVREIAGFLAALQAEGRHPLTADALSGLLPVQPTPWRALLVELIEEWRTEAGTSAVPAAAIVEFCYESLEEQRRERRLGDGVLLTTLHAAKGLEFPHVLIADGGWPEEANVDREDERRLFYVGMTRARETLTLFGIDGAGGGRHPHLSLLQGDWLVSIAPQVEAPPPEVLCRRYSRLGPTDLDLGYAGREPPNHPIHARLASLGWGDTLQLRADGERLVLRNPEGALVGRLSRQAAALWRERLGQIEAVRIDAMLRHGRRLSPPEFAARCQSEDWEVPLVEIRYVVL